MFNLTFGIEIEALLICPLGIEGTATSLVNELLSKPFIAPCYRPECDLFHTYTLPMNYSGLNYDGWLAVEDCSLLLDTEPDHNYRDGRIEIKSRILSFDKPTPCSDHQLDPCPHGGPDWPWQWEVQQVLNNLQSAFNNPECPDYRLKVNWSTGLHVHVGGVQHNLWPKVARNVCGLFTAFERQIDTILPSHRIGSYVRGETTYPSAPLPSISRDNIATMNEHGSLHCSALSGNHLMNVAYTSALRQDLPIDWLLDCFLFRKEKKDPVLAQALSVMHVPAWLYTIMSAQTIEELQEMWQRGRSCAVNVCNLTSDPKNPYGVKQTIEFRCHPGSLDFAEISAWVDMTVNMVRWSANTSSTDCIKYMLDNWQRDSNRILGLAKTVNTTEKTQLHYATVQPRAVARDYALKRYEAISRLEAKDALQTLSQELEIKRMKDASKSTVDGKILKKLCNGFYGKFPQKFIDKFIANNLSGEQQVYAREKSGGMILSENDKAPGSFRHENPVAGWRRALIAVAKQRDAEIVRSA